MMLMYMNGSRVNVGQQLESSRGEVRPWVDLVWTYRGLDVDLVWTWSGDVKLMRKSTYV